MIVPPMQMILRNGLWFGFSVGVRMKWLWLSLGSLQGVIELVSLF